MVRTFGINGVFGSKSARNGGWILIERIASLGITTVITIISARYLGAENFGILNYGLTLVALFAGIMKLGLDSIMVNELISKEKKQGEFLGTSIVLRLASSLLSIGVIALLLFTLNSNQPLLIAVSLVQAIILIFQSVNILDFWFQSNLASKFVSIAKIIATTITGLYSAYLLVTGKSLLWFAASTVITGVVVAVVLLIFYFKQGGQKLTLTRSAAKYLFSKSYHFIIAGIISLVYVQVDKLMIGNILGGAELGLYSAAMMLCTAWLFVPDAIITSLRPGVMRSKKENEAVYLKKLKRLYFIIFWISVLVAGVITVASPFVIPLFFGESYQGAVLVTQVAVWYAPLSTLGVARGVWIVSEEKYKYGKYYLAVGLVVNVVLNITLLPIMGITGAAVATVITEFFTCFVAPLFYRETRIHPKIVLQAIMHKGVS